MGIQNLDKIFHPKSVVVVGASEKSGTIGFALMANLINGKFAGDVYPVNWKQKRIWGLPACRSILDLKSPADLAVIATPISSVPKIIRDCASAGVSGAIIISAGGKETGEKGRAIENTIQNAVGKSGLRIIGPNSLGIISGASKLNVSCARQMPLSGKMAFVSQSGAICTSIIDLSIKNEIGLSYLVSVGSMLDVDFGDVIDFLGGDLDVGSIVMYIESLARFRNFMSAARSVSRIKPIIALKAGRKQAGARAASSHTGAMAGDDAVYDAAFRRAGIVRVKTFEELFDCTELIAKQPSPKGLALAIITNAGGPGVMAVDTMSDYGVEPAELNQETLGKLDRILPPHWSHGNPIDMLGDASPEIIRKVVRVCLNATEIDGLLIIISPQALDDPTDIAATIAVLLQGKSIPMFTAWIGGTDMERGRELLKRSGIPTFDTPERAVRAFMDLYKYSQNIDMLQEIPSRFPRRLEFDRLKAGDIIEDALEDENRCLTEVESKTLLSAYGIPVNTIETALNVEDAVQKAAEIGYPIAMKVLSRDISHKTDAKGVSLNLKDDTDVREAYGKIMASAHQFDPAAVLEGVTVQSMISEGIELIMGVKKDRDFGPVILFGMGGIMTEVLADRAIALPPLNRLLARRLMEDRKIFRLLRGHRGQPAANLELLEEILVRVAQLVTDFSEVDELDINPLIVTKNKALAVDARVILAPSPIQAPHHLVISPYPNEHEARISVNELGNLLIRPIRPEDAPLLVALFESLSPQSIYMRFFTPLKRMDPRMLASFTQIDYDREIALIAIPEADPKEKIIGVARVILERNLKQAEFSVVVTDQWQGRGIDAELLKRCLSIARERKVENIYGTVLAENIQMLKLGRKFGFDIKKVWKAPEYELNLLL